MFKPFREPGSEVEIAVKSYAAAPNVPVGVATYRTITLADLRAFVEAQGPETQAQIRGAVGLQDWTDAISRLGKERDQARQSRDEALDLAERLQAQIAELTKERDEARGKTSDVEALLRAERDEARDEIDRLTRELAERKPAPESFDDLPESHEYVGQLGNTVRARLVGNDKVLPVKMAVALSMALEDARKEITRLREEATKTPKPRAFLDYPDTLKRVGHARWAVRDMGDTNAVPVVAICTLVAELEQLVKAYKPQ